MEIKITHYWTVKLRCSTPHGCSTTERTGGIQLPLDGTPEQWIAEIHDFVLRRNPCIPRDAQLIELRFDRLTGEHTEQYAWRMPDGNWVTTWTGPRIFTQAEAAIWVAYADELVRIGPRTDLNAYELTELADHWSDGLDLDIEVVRQELYCGHVHPINQRHCGD